MANKTLFQTFVGNLLSKTDARNEAGGAAYAFTPRHALAQYAVTGCLNSTFYASASAQLDKVLSLASAVEAEFEAFKRGDSKVAPEVPFQMLTALKLRQGDWIEIAKNASWQMTRMNLNTFARHGLFDQSGITRLIANRLRDPQKVRQARCFPYQLLTSFHSADKATPASVRDALQDAMEVAIENVPSIAGRVFVCPDVSGSMQSPVTGHRAGATTATRCIDVAALVAAAVLRKNPDAEVLAFSDDVIPCQLNPRDTVMTNAQKLAALPSGGTNCSAPLHRLNKRRAEGDLVIFVSDNMSWVDRQGGGRGTATMSEWAEFRSRNPRARLVCLDAQPSGSAQAAEREDILNIGGFSDAVFEIIATFAAGEMNAGHWVGLIEKIDL
jgi:60 kDa SS-A/Ro ribonucleoprotein